MRTPLAGLVGIGISAVVLSAAASAQATTLTYSATTATYVPVPTPPPALNTRALQLNRMGNASAYLRNFIYTGLNSTALGGNWVPLSQTGNSGALASGEQRFEYEFGSATSTVTGPPMEQSWNNNLNLSFGSFYLDGSCDFCGIANAVTVTSASNTGTAQYIDAAPGGASLSGSQNTLTSDVYTITFGSSGYAGTLQFSAATDVTFGTPDVQLSRGTITLNVYAPAPAPLPLFGVAAAFGASRRLRTRLRRQAG